MVPGMEAEEKLKAVQFWNVVSEKLQEIVNNSAADINAVALKMEKENAEKLTLSSHQQTSSMPAQEEKTTFLTAAGSFSTHDEFQGTTVYRENGTLSTDQSLVYLSGSTLTDSSLSSAPSQTHPSSDIQKLSPVSPSLPPAAAVLMDSSGQSSAFETQSCDAQSSSNDIKSWTDCKDDVTKISNSSKVTNTGISQSSSPKASNTSNSENIMDIVESNDESDSDEEVAELVNEDSADNMDQKTTEIVVIQSEGVDRKRGKRSCTGDDIKNLSCEWCLRQFPHISSLTSHRMVHMKPYECKECKARFSNKGNLTVHQRRHTGEKPYSCDNCNAKFSTKGNLRRHVRTHSGENREKPWQCPHCGGCFTEKKSLTVHMRRHTGERPYKCKICEKSFAQSGILQTHMAMHLDQKDFLCEHCGKSFRQKSQLRIHMLRHDGVRNYLCLSCPARFLTKGDLERHNRVHTGERPYVCTLCGKTMTRQQHLNEHMNRHYGLRPYECNYCGKKFAEMSGCYKHIKTHERTQAQQDKMNEVQQYSNTQEQTEFVAMQNQNEPQSHPLRLEGVVVSQADFGPPDVTVFVHSGDQPLELGSEMTVVEQESEDGSSAVIPPSNDDSITTALAEHITDFAAINLLANASSFQQTF
ncbi:uncharacterized protein LOC143237282 isoform X2 [Tachypleus tridentatus]